MLEIEIKMQGKKEAFVTTVYKATETISELTQK